MRTTRYKNAMRKPKTWCLRKFPRVADVSWHLLRRTTCACSQNQRKTACSGSSLNTSMRSSPRRATSASSRLAWTSSSTAPSRWTTRPISRPSSSTQGCGCARAVARPRSRAPCAAPVRRLMNIAVDRARRSARRGAGARSSGA